jgi:hypothetical protein
MVPSLIDAPGKFMRTNRVQISSRGRRQPRAGGRAAFALTTLHGLLLVSLFAAGCTSLAPGPRFVFPTAAETYRASDGRTWVHHASKRNEDGTYWMEFTPSATTEDAPWGEKLGCGVAREHMSRASLKRNLESIQQLFDPTLVFTFEGTDDEFVAEYYSRWKNEHSVTHVIRTDRGYKYFEYRGRLGPAGAGSWSRWFVLVRRLSRQDFETYGSATIRYTPREGDEAQSSLSMITPAGEPARMRSHPPLEFDYPSKRIGTVATVVLDLDVDERGNVTDTVVIQADPSPAGVSARRVYLRSKFVPAQSAGRAIRSRLRVRNVFPI